MKIRETAQNFNHQIVKVAFVFLLSAIVLFAWQTIAKMQKQDEAKTEKKENSDVTIRAKERGNPYVNFKNGVEIVSSTSGESNQNSQPKILSAADFDSDGIDDLVTADLSGTLKFYRGKNLKLTSGETPKLKDEEAFELTDNIFALNISPDYLEAGDFNADGQKDVLAATKGAGFLVLLRGDGRGNFTQPNAIEIGGQITALTIGEIGRRDGQTDVAVSYINKNGSFLAVFEHPESAFKHKPEIFKLPAPATDLAISNLDADFYADIAVASGKNLTVVHGRGQAYPWDLDEKFDIERPVAVVAARRMPFAISALTVGDFNDSRGDDLAILSDSGGVFVLEPKRNDKISNNFLSKNQKESVVESSFAPTDVAPNKYAVLSDSRTADEETAKRLGLSLVDSSLSAKERQEFFNKRTEEAAKNFKESSKEDSARLTAEGAAKAEENRRRAKDAFIKTLSGKPSTLAAWKLVNLTNDARLANAANSSNAQKFIKARVSASGRDDLILVDSVSKQIQIVTRTKTESQFEIVSLDAETNPIAVLPMRLNADALTDLVVLREGSAAPTLVLTAPAVVFTVNSTSDDLSNCLAGETCTLRGAINRANTSGGAAEIDFNNEGGGVQTITLLSQLPTIIQPVTIDGTTQPGYNGLPLIEITGTSLSGQAIDGLKIRTSNTVVRGLNINSMPSTVDQNGSQIGGSGITIESTTNSPNNGNNIIQANFLGTDPTGTLDKGNAATGLNIFDSDNNQIGGTAPNEGNVMSGNGVRARNGVGIAVTAGNSNVFEGNIIGLNSLGTGKVGNSYGLFFLGSDNLFGGDAAGAGNTVSGNGEQRPPEDPQPNGCDGVGMDIRQGINLDTGELLTLNNQLKGNRFGTNPAGTQGFGNCWQAIGTTPLTQTVVGSITPNGRNVVSDNGLDAIYCWQISTSNYIDGGFCAISGNNIGTDITGTIAIPNDWRNQRSGIVFITGTVDIINNLTFSNVGASGGTTPGGACTGYCNLISGNGEGGGVALHSVGFGTVGVFDNFIGTNQNGTQSIPNENRGVVVEGSNTTYVGLGVPNVSLGNLVSGNGGVGVAATTIGPGRYSRAIIQGNLIGTDTSGTFAVSNSVNQSPNFQGGVYVLSFFGDQNLVGGDSQEARNIISGNTRDNGISVYDSGGRTEVVNNLIGLNRSLAPLGNGGNGIFLQGIGTEIRDNQIAYNGTGGNDFAGVLVSSSALGNTIRNNSIHDNSGLGIDLTGGYNHGDGVTANDCQDADTGANDLQNFPELLAPVQYGGGTITVSGVLRSNPQDTYAIDFYSNSQPDPSGYGEGATFIGSVNATTDGNGFAEFVFTSDAPVSASLAITATATDGYGSTSEFSAIAGTSGSANLEELSRSLQFTCAQPIIVTTTSNFSDSNINDGVCDIDLNTPGEQCSLRAAIEEANHRPGFNQISFLIGAPDSMQTISPTSLLPAITESVDIDATSQASVFVSPLIELRGDAANLSEGLRVQSGSATIRGFTINHFQQAGIVLAGGANHRIESNYIGINPDGTTADTTNRQGSGIFISGSNQNKIGGTTAASINVISNNLSGIVIQNSSDNIITLNKIGTDKTGTMPLGNDTGIALGLSATGNFIGDRLNAANVISGNNNSGIALINFANNNTITGNYIGTKAGGMEALPNGQRGVFVADGAKNNYIGNGGGNFNLENRNIISGQNDCEQCAGILIDATAGIENHVEFNYLGVNKDATDKIPNRNGVVVFADKQRIGSSNGNLPNVISGNQNDGVLIAVAQGSPNTVVENVSITNNYIGTNLPGTATDLGNGGMGIHLNGNVSETLIEENTVGNNALAGITLENGATLAQIKTNKIGLKDDSTLLPNPFGLVIKGSTNNTVFDNIIAGNTGFGVLLGFFAGQNFRDERLTKFIQTPSYSSLNDGGQPSPVTSGNKIVKNKIGTDGSVAIPNGQMGLVVGEYARDNCIGTCFGRKNGNTISGHTLNSPLGYGIFLGTLTTNPDPLVLPRDNVFKDNIVGMNTAVTECLPNNIGMFIIQAGPNRVGVLNGGNLFNCNTVNGVSVKDQADGDLIIENNYIGYVPHYGNFGNLIMGLEASQEIIRDRNTGITIIRNTVGNNGGNGVTVRNLQNSPLNQKSAGGSVNTAFKMSGNFIGVAKLDNGTTIKIANGVSGVLLDNVKNAVIGVADAAENAEKNIISGNDGAGIMIEGDESEGNVINNSIIGTDENGADNLGNGDDGIAIFNAVNTRVGDVGDTVRNSIAGNNGAGIRISGSLAASNRIINNSIGFALNGNARSNLGDGVLITDNARLNEVGGHGENDGNLIAFSGGAGVRIDETAGHCNLVDPNSISDNQGLGIDIGSPGFTPNDLHDADEGANRGQNYPEIVSKQIVNGELIVGFKTDSAPGNSNYGANGLYVEFFKADSSGEGERFLGSTYYTIADYDGGSAGTKTVNLGNITTLGINSSDPITATATDADNNTSEFFPPFAPTAASVSIGGRVTSADGQGISKARLSLTGSSGQTRIVISNAFGYYHFNDVSVGQTYILTISAKHYSFKNPAQILFITEETDRIDFTASP